MNVLLWIAVTLVTEWALKTIWRDYIEPPLAQRRERLDTEDRADEAELAEWRDAMRASPITIPALSTVWTVQDRLEDIARRIAKIEQ